MTRNFINKYKRHFQKNYLIYFILTFCLVIGIIVGSFISMKFNENENFKLINHFSWIFKYLNGKIYGFLEVFKASFFSNIFIVLLIWILGLIRVGIFIIPIIIVLKGMIIGFTIGFIVSVLGLKGFLLSLFGFFPHFILVIPVFLVIGSISGYNSISQKKHLNNNILRNPESLNYFVVLIFVSAIIFLDAIIEGFLSSHLLELMKI